MPQRENIGTVSVGVKERSAVNNQGLVFTTVQDPRSAFPERVEFFESLQEVSTFLREGDQDKIQSKLDHLDQMLDIITMSLADIGSEMQSIESEISINADLKLQLETTLSSKEDVDFTTAITDMQAKMMSLEAAQSSFAKISQLTVFDYIR
jgi:flagellar hook-associated protein 3 FlgL